jgi:hypothetical protein
MTNFGDKGNFIWSVADLIRYRTALISAAVTGKIDIRQEVAA